MIKGIMLLTPLSYHANITVLITSTEVFSEQICSFYFLCNISGIHAVEMVHNNITSVKTATVTYDTHSRWT